MAVVLNSEENSYFTSSPLRRSHSQPKFISPQSSCANLSFRSKKSNSFRTLKNLPASVLSSGAASPRSLLQHSISSCSPTSSDFSTEVQCGLEEDADQIIFPFYDDSIYYGQSDGSESPGSPRTGSSYTVSSPESSAHSVKSKKSKSPESPKVAEHAEDDTAVEPQPSRHVDYLSHNWREEDIWLSWKHVVAKRKAYTNSARLENASWRTWVKEKNKLRTVTPEALNWLKDCDVTWLYGPLQSLTEGVKAPASSPNNGCRKTDQNSGVFRKPILKKRSMSEILLRRSLSSSSLLKHAAATVRSQRRGGSGADSKSKSSKNATSKTKNPTSGLSSRHSNSKKALLLSSISSSNFHSPVNYERKRIHFNEQVEQCIALEIKGDDDEPYYSPNYDSDSDDGGIMMKKSTFKRKLPPLVGKKKPRAKSVQESKTIAMLPSTTLKHKPSSPGSSILTKKYSSEFYSGSLLSTSPSFGSLRPSKSSKMLLGDDDEDMNWLPSDNRPNRRDSKSVAQDRSSELVSSRSSPNISESESLGLKRTPSGMFMPLEENEDDITSEGLFGKVVETVNTAKDIAHVIWNVGWMR